MKCIRCSHDSKLKERAGGICPSCNGTFAFEPTAGDKMTDGGFQSAIERVSSTGTVKFTSENLYYEIVRGMARKALVSARGMMIFGGIILTIGVIVGFLLLPVGIVIGIIGGLLFFGGISNSRTTGVALITQTEVRTLLTKWTKAHGQPKGLIVRRESAPPKQIPRDVAHYSFDRAVITDRRDTADLLIANNFHFENNCAILSMDGYPEAIFPTVLAMLRNNRRLNVYVVHNITAVGCALATKLQSSPEWFARTGARIVDVGLHPEHATPFRGAWQRQTGTVDTSGLPAAQRAWLSNYWLDIAAVRPEQIIKRLFRAMNGESERFMDAGSGDTIILVDHDSFSSDATSSDGGGDSFG